MALGLDFESIENLCTSNTKFKKEIHDNALFWRGKYLQDVNLGDVKRILILEEELKILTDFYDLKYRGISFKDLSTALKIDIYEAIYNELVKIEDKLNVLIKRHRPFRELKIINTEYERRGGLYFINNRMALQPDRRENQRCVMAHIVAPLLRKMLIVSSDGEKLPVYLTDIRLTSPSFQEKYR